MKAIVRSYIVRLAAEGVPDVYHEPYQAGTLEIFATLIVRAFGETTLEAGVWADIVNHAHIFSAEFWHWYIRHSGAQLRFSSAHIVATGHRGGLTLRTNNWNMIEKPASYISIARPGLAGIGRWTDLHEERASARAAAMLPEIERILRQGIPDKLVQGQPAVTHRKGARPGYFGAYQVSMATSQKLSFTADPHQFINNCDDYLLQWVQNFIQKVRQGERNFQSLLAHRSVDKILAKQAEETGLPIRFYLVPCFSDSRVEGGCASLMMEGYGPDGGITQIDMQSSMGVNHDQYVFNRPHLIAEQRRRHKIFGPRPGKKASMTVDGVTAAKLKAMGVGRRPIDQYLENPNTNHCAPGVKFSTVGKKIMGRFDLAPTVQWKGDSVAIHGLDITETMIQAIAGRPVKEIIKVPGLEMCTTIGSGKMTRSSQRKYVTFRIRCPVVLLADLAA